MKKQQHSVTRSGSGDDFFESGTSIADLAAGLKEQDLGVNFSSVHPIDTLLVQQLEKILNGEKALRARYSALDSTANTSETRSALSRELSDLQNRADRLYRLMNAMDYYGPFDPKEALLHAPATA